MIISAIDGKARISLNLCVPYTKEMRRKKGYVKLCFARADDNRLKSHEDA